MWQPGQGSHGNQRERSEHGVEGTVSLEGEGLGCPWCLEQCAGLAGQGARRTHPGREGWV